MTHPCTVYLMTFSKSLQLWPQKQTLYHFIPLLLLRQQNSEVGSLIPVQTVAFNNPNESFSAFLVDNIFIIYSTKESS